MAEEQVTASINKPQEISLTPKAKISSAQSQSLTPLCFKY